MNSRSPHSFFQKKKIRKHSGVSPVIATTILIGVTVTLGLALWSYSASQVNTSTLTFANEVTDYVNYVNDRYVIVNMAFEHDEPAYDACNAANSIAPFDSQCVTIWVYNHGDVPATLTRSSFGPSPNSLLPVDESKESLPLTIPPRSLGNFTINNSPDGFTQGTTYYVKVVSESGAQQSYFQRVE